ncbi:uncharacterized protein [Chelonus insularis]|uniref:uncharacterized protein n=1 Tax=Chelonus insularis TaxID=460826 RepID=UPI00158BB9A7|nr:uncharacterized protein LOC118065158 [Chelonus insularis]XP_034936159.1 uncharacterized protein LOC118065158 [Chelonus insularis]XP_034936160.1 uncharacterized protein LOC118065158 [Chelonus insularis]
MNSKETNHKGLSEVDIQVEEVESDNNLVTDEDTNSKSTRENVSNNSQSSRMDPSITNYEEVGASTQSKFKYSGSHSSSTNIPINSHNLTINSSNSNVQSNHLNTCFNVDTSLIAITSEVSFKTSENELQEDADMINNVDYNCQINKCPPKVSCSTRTTPEIDLSWSQSSCVSECLLNNIGVSIGSTSQGTCNFLRPNINGNKDGSGPSGLSKTFKRDQNERRDSSSGNEGEDFSDAEDYCIYTYKGNDQGNVDERVRENSRNVENYEAAGLQSSGRSSPEMDFLEMDFDPGPSCEQDTGDSDLASITEDIQNIALDNIESDSVFLNDLSSGKVVSRQSVPLSPQPSHSKSNVNMETKSKENESPFGSMTTNHNQAAQCLPSTSTTTSKLGSQNYYNNAGIPSRESHGYHNTSGDLISPGDNRDVDSELWADTATAVPLPENSGLQWLKVNLSSTLWHRMMAKKLMLHKQTTFSQSEESNLENELSNDKIDDFRPVERIMLWSEQEAAMKQVTQIATSACGATSAVNALLALDVPFSPEVLVKGVATRLREPGTPLPRYLVSRSQAGATHKDIIRGLSLATNGAVISKFFAFYPERAISLSHWLYYWISRGAAPIATLNLQNCGKGCKIPDAWHHQMIFGVSQAGIYLTNPLECLPEQLVWHQLVSPSVLLIRRADVLAHWNPTTDLTALMRMDHRWRRLNVLGQVVNMIRESSEHNRQPVKGSVNATHIRIPASYQAGITLVMRSDVPAAEELLNAEQLPLL